MSLTNLCNSIRAVTFRRGSERLHPSQIFDEIYAGLEPLVEVNDEITRKSRRAGTDVSNLEKVKVHIVSKTFC